MGDLSAFAKSFCLHHWSIPKTNPTRASGLLMDIGNGQYQGVEEVGEKAEKTKRTLALWKLMEIYGRPLDSSYRDTEILRNFTNTLKGQGGLYDTWVNMSSSQTSYEFLLCKSLC